MSIFCVSAYRGYCSLTDLCVYFRQRQRRLTVGNVFFAVLSQHIIATSYPMLTNRHKIYKSRSGILSRDRHIGAESVNDNLMLCFLMVKELNMFGTIRVWLWVIAGFVFVPHFAYGQDASNIAQTKVSTVITLTDQSASYPIGLHLSLYEDVNGELSFDEVSDESFKKNFFMSQSKNPSFGFTDSVYWVHFSVTNDALERNNWFLEFDYAPIQFIEFFSRKGNGPVTTQTSGMAIPVSSLPYKHHYPVFPLDIAPTETMDIWLRLSGESSMNIPLKIYSTDAHARKTSTELALMGIYTGILFALLAYNIFIFFILRESIYLYYVCFLCGNVYNALAIHGILKPLLYPNSPELMLLSIPSVLSAICCFGTLFVSKFLGMATYFKKLAILFKVGTFVSFVGIFIPWFFGYRSGMFLAVFTLLVFCSTALFVGFYSAFAKIPAAKYYVTSWTALLIGAVAYLCQTLGIIPYSVLAEYGLLVGSALEAILLSVALAARMRTLIDKTDRIQSQQIKTERAMVQAQREAAAAKEEALSKQKELLDQKTLSLAQEKRALQQEKFASLGLLSASVAHEINNPNNYISLSAQSVQDRVRSLQEYLFELMDDEPEDDIKQDFITRFKEINNDTSRIMDGSQRINTIVRSMRGVSREDSGTLVEFDPVEQLLSTLELVRPAFKQNVSFQTEDLSLGNIVKAAPARINQVFMNLLVNACQAIEEKQLSSDDDYIGKVKLESVIRGDHLDLMIEDNGCGIPESIKDRLFHEQLTTKDQDKGTGLGLKICEEIIKEFQGSISLFSEEMVGSKFIISLPLFMDKS